MLLYSPTPFSALQRAEIAEIVSECSAFGLSFSFSALQRAEIAEMDAPARRCAAAHRAFSALQRAEIAEIIDDRWHAVFLFDDLSVLFNEPKLLKYFQARFIGGRTRTFSALQRAEIAEIIDIVGNDANAFGFQCSSTSRNC